MSAAVGLQFFEDGHRYLLNGQPVPSVTQVLEPLTDYSHVPPAVLAHAQAIGTAVHRACELFDRDDLVMDSLDPRILGYLAAWQRFKSETGFVVEAAELRLASDVYRVAGTLDRVGLLRGVLGKPRAILEIKTTADFMPSFGPQLAGYWQLWRESKRLATSQLLATRRYAVQLREDGTYRLQRYADHADFSVFTACLTLFHWRNNSHV